MDFRSLKHSNNLALVAHLLSALTLVVLYVRWPATNSRSSVTTFRNTIAGPDDELCNTASGLPTPSKCNVEVGLTKPQRMTSVNVVYGSIAFFVITAFAHAFYATDGFGSGSYTKAIDQGWNPYRWFEYATSASIMSALIGLVDGIRDIQLIFVLVLLTAAMQFCGYTVESLLRGTSKVGAHARDAIIASSVVGWLLFFALWFTIFWTFSNVVSDVKTKYADEIDPDTNEAPAVPGWIWFVVIAQLVYYALFGIVQYRHIKARFSGKAYDYISTEKSYISLSFFAKLSLASGIGYGLLFRTKDCPV